jgi:5-methylcytosine-specific restriction enzyme A
MRARQLAKEPLCEMCKARGLIVAATVADHTIPHHGDPELFYDTENLTSLCSTCHSATKRMQETHGYSQAAGLDGMPSDAGHPWNKKRK